MLCCPPDPVVIRHPLSVPPARRVLCCDCFCPQFPWQSLVRLERQLSIHSWNGLERLFRQHVARSAQRDPLRRARNYGRKDVRRAPARSAGSQEVLVPEFVIQNVRNPTGLGLAGGRHFYVPSSLPVRRGHGGSPRGDPGCQRLIRQRPMEPRVPVLFVYAKPQDGVVPVRVYVLSCKVSVIGAGFLQGAGRKQRQERVSYFAAHPRIRKRSAAGYPTKRRLFRSPIREIPVRCPGGRGRAVSSGEKIISLHSRLCLPERIEHRSDKVANARDGLGHHGVGEA